AAVLLVYFEHIALHGRAYTGAVCKEEIGNIHFVVKVFVAYEYTVLIEECKRWDLMVNRIHYGLSVDNTFFCRPFTDDRQFFLRVAGTAVERHGKQQRA